MTRDYRFLRGGGLKYQGRADVEEYRLAEIQGEQWILRYCRSNQKSRKRLDSMQILHYCLDPQGQGRETCPRIAPERLLRFRVRKGPQDTCRAVNIRVTG